MLRDLNNAADRYIGPTNCGVLGSAIPSTGDDAPAYMYDVVAADAALLTKEVRGKIVRFPANGTLTPYDDSSYVYTRTNDGSDYFDFQPYANGAPYGDVKRVVLNVGAVGKSVLIRNLNVLRNMGF